MNRDRSDRIRRVVSAQRELQRAAEWALHDLRRQEAAVRTARQEIVTALARDDNLLVGLAPALSRRLDRLAARADELALARRHQAEVLRERTGRLRQAERLGRAAEVAVARSDEKSGLEELVDTIMAGVRATFR